MTPTLFTNLLIPDADAPIASWTPPSTGAFRGWLHVGLHWINGDGGQPVIRFGPRTVDGAVLNYSVAKYKGVGGDGSESDAKGSLESLTWTPSAPDGIPGKGSALFEFEFDVTEVGPMDVTAWEPAASNAIVADLTLNVEQVVQV